MWCAAERDWMRFGLCRVGGKLPAVAWRCGENGQMELAGRQVDCAEVTKMAVMICQTCPVQWSCTRFAVEVGEQWGTWGTRIRFLRWLQEDIEMWDAMLILEDAETAAIPVEVAVRDAKKARRCTGGRVSSAA
jgi:hypothetical protein